MVEKNKSSSQERWVWGDEINPPKNQPAEEFQGKTYTSVVELLADEEAAEIKRLEEFFALMSKLKNQ